MRDGTREKELGLVRSYSNSCHCCHRLAPIYSEILVNSLFWKVCRGICLLCELHPYLCDFRSLGAQDQKQETVLGRVHCDVGLSAGVQSWVLVEKNKQVPAEVTGQKWNQPGEMLGT